MNEYPPLTSVIAYPLHPTGIYPPDYVWACEHPERPRDNRTAYDWRCRPCVMLAEAHIRIHGDQVVAWKVNDRAEPTQVAQSWLVERSLHWLGFGGRG